MFCSSPQQKITMDVPQFISQGLLATLLLQLQLNSSITGTSVDLSKLAFII